MTQPSGLASFKTYTPMLPTRYPPDAQAPFMQESGPSNPDFVVKDGTLLFHQQRDGRFPYLYRVSSHPLVDEMIDKTAIKNILVYVQDTEPTALKQLLDFENTLFVPLGPNNLMPGLGENQPIIDKYAGSSEKKKKQVYLKWRMGLLFMPVQKGI